MHTIRFWSHGHWWTYTADTWGEIAHAAWEDCIVKKRIHAMDLFHVLDTVAIMLLRKEQAKR